MLICSFKISDTQKQFNLTARLSLLKFRWNFGFQDIRVVITYITAENPYLSVILLSIIGLDMIYEYI